MVYLERGLNRNPVLKELMSGLLIFLNVCFLLKRVKTKLNDGLAGVTAGMADNQLSTTLLLFKVGCISIRRTYV